jgi:ferredoxin-type protein NapH
MVSMANPKSLAQRLQPWRSLVQTGFLLVWLDPFMLRLHTICGPVFHCYSCPLATFACPIGVMAQFSAIHVLPLLALGTVVLVGAIFGGFVCGWACPFGLLQDLVARLPTRKFALPRWIGYLRYAVLIGMVGLIPFFFGPDHPLFICRLCPAGGLESALPRAIPAALDQARRGLPIVWPMTKTVVVAVFVAAMLLVYRPWCRACPLGAIFGLFNRISAFFLRFKPEACTACQVCHTQCRLGIAPDQQPNDTNCIRCLDCARCPPQALDTDQAFRKPPAQP